MHEVHLLSVATGLPITRLVAEAVDRYVSERLLDGAARAEDERVAEGPADKEPSP